MFTQRQLYLLSYLASVYGELSGIYLSKMLDVSSKTVQEEIKDINRVLKGKGMIIYSPKAGYKLSCTDEMRKELTSIINSSSEMNTESPRGNLIISVLAMQDGYISMEKIAYILNVSKTAVSKELEMFWRIKRNIEVSTTKGLRLDISESKIRRVLSATFDGSEQQIDILHLKSGIDKYLPIIIRITNQEFLDDFYVVSGMQLREFQNYLLFTIVRNEQKRIIENLEPINISNLMNRIALKMEKELNVKLSQNDLLGAQKKLNELNLLHANKVPLHNRELYFEVQEKLQQFLAVMKKDFNISTDLEDLFQERFLTHMIKLIGRVKDGNHNKNFYKREINADNPFYAQVLRDYFIPIFGIEMKDSEAAYIIMYLVAMLDKGLKQLPLLIVSDMNPSMVYGIQYALLRSKVKHYFDEIQVMPQYQYIANAEYYNSIYSIILTTENKMLFENSEVLLIKKVLSKEDIEVVTSQLVNMFETKYQQKLEQTSAKYLNKESFIFVDKNYDRLRSFLDDHMIKYDDGKYKIVVKANMGFFPEFIYDKKDSFVNVYIFKHPIANKGYKIEYLIVSGYNIEDDNYEYFYAVLQKLFQSSNIKKYLSTY